MFILVFIIITNNLLKPCKKCELEIRPLAHNILNLAVAISIRIGVR